MQLIYLYIDNYKNIQKQGFNFSAKYKCSFDGKVLNIKKQEYLKIFPNNININAIVGKNGSGKSTIFKFILMLIFFNKYKKLDKKDYEYTEEYDNFLKKEDIQSSNIGKNGNRGFLIIKKGKEFYRLTLLVDLLSKNTYQMGIVVTLNGVNLELNDLNEDDIDFFSIHYNYLIDTLKDDSSDDNFIDKIYHKTDGYETPLLLEPYKRINGKEQIDIENLQYLSYSKFANIFRLGITNEFIETFFNPNFVKLSVNLEKLKSKIDLLSKNIFANPLVIVDNDNPIKMGKDHIFRYMKPNDFKNIITELYNQKNFLALNRIYIAFKILEKDYWKKFNWQNKNIYNAVFCSKNINESIESIIKNMNLPDIQEKLEKSNIPKYEYQKILNAIKFETEILNKNIKFQYFLNKKNKLEDLKKILEDISPWIDIEYFENDKSYKSLSSGEKTIFAFMINLMYHINNLKDTKYKTINIFLDEVELGLHPDWQKRFLKYILKTIRVFNINVNLVFATHSPFILSDIPKENIVFLEDGVNKTENIKVDTFGANIHTLLSHGFFMEDGLMGEFARDEIEKVISILNKTILTEEEIKEYQKFISIVGEPLIKNQLQKMLDVHKLNYLYGDVYKEIEVLKHRIEFLRSKI